MPPRVTAGTLGLGRPDSIRAGLAQRPKYQHYSASYGFRAEGTWVHFYGAAGFAVRLRAGIHGEAAGADGNRIDQPLISSVVREFRVLGRAAGVSAQRGINRWHQQRRT